jgi:SAM-dependent methyltransferase
MRHLVNAHACGQIRVPDTVAELGPGDSLGVGLAALLTGAGRYYAFDFIKYANNLENIHVFDELVQMFSKNVDIPDDQEFPEVIPRLASYKFPSHILSNGQLQQSLAHDRVQRIRAAISAASDPGNIITYIAPWFDSDLVKSHTVDMIFSQAVLEHIDPLQQAYGAMHLWLKPSGIMSHSIDFRSHGLTTDWNGHWAQSEIAWKLLRGKRPYMINRQPHSFHLKLLREAGFDVLRDEHYKLPSRIKGSMIAGRFSNISDEDLSISETFIVAVPSSRHVS